MRFKTISNETAQIAGNVQAGDEIVAIGVHLLKDVRPMLSNTSSTNIPQNHISKTETVNE